MILGWNKEEYYDVVHSSRPDFRSPLSSTWYMSRVPDASLPAGWAKVIVSKQMVGGSETH